ncbi:hypothetical protein GCM10010112_55930 [Actinoplanes lobatus]|uniref:Uncharacterized membrane protein HdeD (DUF308 family) n=1 Tax=Actinoplanes lobatus TaxID=113568 RepID=A0A7W7HEP6_9ACTN|nr:hypothetical protein [Actinoplanes lobatus]MBB4749188.1 uncharacterized membrane protein HdeD (DUF308 family) [Actinoplanes lobatus]GGN80408.1 hypothetical protein GCM10010112_55930 [Actinoplanes lobatus]GIE45253.1 hypothetical protein Alo02nite_81510 [Actinoplanes lobatus]
MTGRTSRGERSGGFTLLMLCTTASILLLTVALLVTSSEDVADATPFGRIGTLVVTVGAALVVCASAVIARHTAVPAVRATAVGASIIAAALVAVMAFLFLFANSAQFAVGLLLACAAVLVALGGRAVAQASGTREAR